MADLPPEQSTASFWHSEPSPYLQGHRTTDELPTEADVVIVGSGITGASAARYLSEDARSNKLKVVMLEAREACWGATGRNGGHCQPLILHGTPDVVAFEFRNWHTVKSYVEDNKVPCEWRVNDACRAVYSERFAKNMTANLEHLVKVAPELASNAEIITDAEVLKSKYKVKDSVQALAVGPVAALWPYKLVVFILERAIKNGTLNLQSNTAVTSLSQTQASNGSPCHIVSTPRGSIRTRHVILTTNAYTSHLLPSFTGLIVPERGTMSALLPPQNSTRLAHSYGFIGPNGQADNHQDYLNQRPGSKGHLMYGGGQGAAEMEYMNTVDDSIVDEKIAFYLRRELLHLMDLDGDTKGLNDLEASYVWSGIWGTSRDLTPWVGAVPGDENRNLWLAGGYSGHGMPNATLCAKAVVDMVLEQESGAPLDYVEERLVRTGQLPKSYLISEDRIERCRKMDSVQLQDRKAWIGCQMPRVTAERRG